jgi:hypothetical protein
VGEDQEDEEETGHTHEDPCEAVELEALRQIH